MSDVVPRRAARAIDALRRGWAVRIGEMVFLPVETADEEQTDAFDPSEGSAIVMSFGRAATLRIVNQLAAADPASPVAAWRAQWHDWRALQAIADPADDLAHPMKGPFQAVEIADRAAAAAALELARLAGILPVFLMKSHADFEVFTTPADIAAFAEPARLRIVTRVQLPLSAAEDATIVAFRSPDDPREHVALVIGDPARAPDGSPPLVRLHSECLTGDVFGSLKCDCGPQLDAALAAIAAECERGGWGILLYLRQEGRGIGLINKLRAYQLQDLGFDTVDANTRLGFAVDARDFGVAARMLDLLGEPRVRLMTNNPAKVAALEAAGIDVVERVAHALPPNRHNERYLATKRDRTGHQL